MITRGMARRRCLQRSISQRAGHRRAAPQASQCRVPAVPANHRGQRPARVGHPPRDGQLRDAQDPLRSDPGSHATRGSTSTSLRPLHPGSTRSSVGSQRSRRATSVAALIARPSSSSKPFAATSSITTPIPNRSCGPSPQTTYSQASRGSVCELLTHDTRTYLKIVDVLKGGSQNCGHAAAER